MTSDLGIKASRRLAASAAVAMLVAEAVAVVMSRQRGGRNPKQDNDYQSPPEQPSHAAHPEASPPPEASALRSVAAPAGQR